MICFLTYNVADLNRGYNAASFSKTNRSLLDCLAHVVVANLTEKRCSTVYGGMFKTTYITLIMINLIQNQSIRQLG